MWSRVMNKPVDPAVEETKARMRSVLELQKRVQTAKGPPDARVRKDRLTRAINLLLTHKDDLLDALNADFGNRSRDMGALTDIVAAIAPLKSAREQLEHWMKPQKRKVTPGALALLGAKAEVRYQPKGVVGIMTPWNFPVQLTVDAIAGAFAAGNRVMVKPSELTPATSALMAKLFDLFFDEDEIAFILGGPDVGAAFLDYPVTHEIYTG